jgi:long-chain fatty acid transport protein
MLISLLRYVRWVTVQTACIMLAAFAVVSASYAQTPRIQGQGSAASGMGNAFAAQADDASALHYNPAGMTQLRGVQNMFGLLLVGGTTEFRNAAGVTASGNRDNSVAWPSPAHFYLTANLKDIGFSALGDMTVGIGVTNPFGSLTRYPQTAPFSAVGPTSAAYFQTLPLIDIKPTVAYKLNDQLSFGLGADIYTFSSMFGEGQAEQKVQVAPPVNVELNGSDTAAGFNVSMMYTPLRNADGKPLANIGLVYRSQATLHLTGEQRINGALTADASATLVLPYIYTVGIGIWPVRDKEREWKLEMDVDYVGWKANRNLDVRLSNNTTILNPQQWNSSYTVMIGTEYKWLNPERMPDWEIALRGGYMNQQTQMPDATFSPTIPSANTHTPSLGAGFLCKENGSFFGLKCGGIGIGAVKVKSIGLDLVYQALYYESRTVAGQATNPAINGTYQTTIHAGGVSLRFNF